MPINLGSGAISAAKVGSTDVSKLMLGANEVFSAAAADPNFADVSLLLHMDGSNGSTTFTDSSSNGLATSAIGDAAVSTAQAKFGESVYLDGIAFGTGSNTYDAISITNSNSAMTLGTGDFTVEMFFYPWNNPALGSSNSYNLNNFGTFFTGGTNALMLRYHSSYSSIVVGFEGVAYDIIPSPALLPTENSWNHIAVVRDSTSLRLYLNGSLGGEATGTAATRNYTELNKIGQYSTTQFPLQGYLDEFRVTKVARYTGSSYTVPTEAFPNS